MSKILSDKPEPIRPEEMNQAMATVLHELADIKRQLSTIKGSTDLMTATDVCKWFKITKPGLYRMINEGRIPFKKRGRNYLFSRAEIEIWFKSETKKNE